MEEEGTELRSNIFIITIHFLFFLEIKTADIKKETFFDLCNAFYLSHSNVCNFWELE